MPYINLKTLITLIVSMFISLNLISAKVAQAEEEKKAEEAKGEGAKAEGEAAKGEGGGEKKGEGSDREWAKRMSKQAIIEAKIKELKKIIHECIEAKNSGHVLLDEKGAKVDLIPKIAEAHKELEKAAEEYETGRNDMEYHFPEKGALIERRYLPIHVQTVEQIEKELGINGELTLTKQALDKKYESLVGEKPAIAPKPKGRAEATLKETHPKKTAEENSKNGQPERLKLSQ